MGKAFIKVVFFVLTIIAAFIYVSDVLTKISGGGKSRAALGLVGLGVSPEAGEAIFWGNGKCGTCHSVGSKGSAIRCPNLGESDNGPIIGIRAEERAKELSQKRGAQIAATDYLVESLAEPGAYLVEGFKNEMPYVYKPPISLNADEIKAVILYLQSSGGIVDIGSIKLPAKILQASKEKVEPFKPYIKGDPKVGEELFFDPESNAGCGKCHTAIDSKGVKRGGNVGPDLSAVAGTRTPQFILESILDPSKEIASGFEQVLIVAKDGRMIDGIPKKEDAASITLVRREGDNIVEMIIPKSEIGQKLPQEVSAMPGNFAEILMVQELHDILAFVLTQTGETETQPTVAKP